MAISVGDRIPDVTLMTMTGEGPRPVQRGEVLGSGKVVLFAVPGAFTPTCSDHHLPGFVVRAATGPVHCDYPRPQPSRRLSKFGGFGLELRPRGHAVSVLDEQPLGLTAPPAGVR